MLENSNILMNTSGASNMIRAAMKKPFPPQEKESNI
jgi:hypothetical protein